MKNITLYDGRNHNINTCIGCDIYNGSIDMSQSIIYENDFFRIMQDTETPIPGFFVISSKRHIRTLNDLSEKELQNLFPLLLKLRRGMSDLLKIEKVSTIQEDGSKNGHFHLWLFPWHSWMDDLYSNELETSRIRKIMKYAQNNMRKKENIETIHAAIRTMRKIFDDN